MPLPQGPYLSAFQILCGDFRRILEFIEPVDQNLEAYSHRLYELLLRACTEFESAAKELLVIAGSSKAPADMTINDYKTLESSLHMEAREVGILLWQPTPAYVKPFHGWSTAAPPVGWYSDYNKVKHSRNNEFSRANLDNARTALAGLFLILAVDGVISSNQFGFQERNARGGTARECVYPGQIFSLIK
jgi:hypothetical protein